MDEIVTDTIDNGTIENVHIAPIGEFLGSDAEGNPVPEKLTPESLQAIADGLNQSGAEVLADIDHGAAKPGVERDTKAAGWFSRFVLDPIKGLFASLKLTKHGKELLENREYRYISPTFSLDEEGRPVQLHTASLTNMPAFKGHINPILNSEAKEISKNDEEGKIHMDMTRDELVSLIKDTVAAINAAPAVDEEKKEETCENTCSEETEKKEEVVENACTEVKNSEEEPKAEEKTEEVVEAKEEAAEEKAEVKEETEEEKTEEEKKEEEKDEVIKIDALNSAPVALKDVSGKSEWMNLHGKDFWAYLSKHPEIKG